MVLITSGAIHAYVPAALIRVVFIISRANPKSVIFSTFSKFPSSILFKSKTGKKRIKNLTNKMSGSYMFKVSSIVFNQTLLTANFFKQTLNNVSIQQAHSYYQICNLIIHNQSVILFLANLEKLILRSKTGRKWNSS